MSRGDADREAYERRAQELRDRIGAGETITEIMEAKQLDRALELMERMDREERESRERQDRR